MKTHKYVVKEPHLKETLEILNDITEILKYDHNKDSKIWNHEDEMDLINEIIDQLKYEDK